MILLSAAGCALREGDARHPLTGGFSEAPVTGEEVVEAALFAAGEMDDLGYPGAALSEIVSAEQQVVSGINYRLLLEIESGGRKHLAEAVVWRKLSGEYELISLEPRE